MPSHPDRVRKNYETPKEGVFVRDGERWLREHGREFRLLDLAPHLERQWMMRHEVEGDMK